MKTDELARLLSTGVAPVPRRAAARRLGLALGVGLLLSLVVLALGYGPRRDLAQVAAWPMFWVKLLFPACVAGGAFVLLQRLARPGVAPGRAWLALALPVLLVWGLALAAWFGAPAGQRMPLLMGRSWRECLPSIALIGLPVLVGAALALRGLAPTRPALAGAAAGALAGGVGAAVYALHCQELTAPFLAVWYVGGIALSGAVGALLGPRLLRW